MKKLLAICFAVLMVASMSISAFATSGGFVISPSAKPAPEVESFEASSDDCTAVLIVTPYAERNTLTVDEKTQIESAYNEVVSSKDLTNLCEEMDNIASSKKIAGKDLAVSDLFDIRMEGCDVDHDQHGAFKITLTVDALSNFVCLLHRNADGSWEVIKDAKVVDGDSLSFVADDFSPFAIVVDGSKQGPSQTGDETMIGLYIAIMAVSAVAIVILVSKSKKQRA